MANKRFYCQKYNELVIIMIKRTMVLWDSGDKVKFSPLFTIPVEIRLRPGPSSFWKWWQWQCKLVLDLLTRLSVWPNRNMNRGASPKTVKVKNLAQQVWPSMYVGMSHVYLVWPLLTICTNFVPNQIYKVNCVLCNFYPPGWSNS